jgi:hypothetical protein
MPAFRMNWDINVGNLLTVVAFLGMMSLAWFQMREDVKILQYQYIAVDKKVVEIIEAQKMNRDDLKKELSDLRTQLTIPLSKRY